MRWLQCGVATSCGLGQWFILVIILVLVTGGRDYMGPPNEGKDYIWYISGRKPFGWVGSHQAVGCVECVQAAVLATRFKRWASGIQPRCWVMYRRGVFHIQIGIGILDDKVIGSLGKRLML